MKRIGWTLTGGAVALMMALMLACGSKNEVTPLIHSLVIFSEKDSVGEGSLAGVKDARTDTVVVRPDRFLHIMADPPFIICTRKDGDVEMKWVYQLNGEPVGRFECFDHWRQPSGPDQVSPAPDYFLGVNYKRRFYYFPKTDIAIHTTEAYDEVPGCLLLLDKDVWKAIAYDGEVLRFLPWDAQVVHDRSTQRLYWLHEERGHHSVVDILSGQAVSNWQEPQAAEIRTWPGLTMKLV